MSLTIRNNRIHIKTSCPKHRAIEKAYRFKWLIAVLSLFLAYILSILLRLDNFQTKVGSENLEATYHAAWTMTALSNSSVDEHFLLPTVTLEPHKNNDIHWGATVPTPKGSYIYTSFPSLGFLIPFFTLEKLNLPFDVFTLAIFNSLVGLIAALGIGGLVRSVALHIKNNGVPASDTHDVTGWLVFAASSICYLFLRESLQSHGAVYWPHSLSQVVFIFSSWLAFRISLNYAEHRKNIGLLVLCCLYPLLEWTGFIFNFGLAAGLFLYRLHSNPKKLTFVSLCSTRGWVLLWREARGLPLAITVATLVVGMVMLLHLFFAIGYHNTINALISRAFYRSGIFDDKTQPFSTLPIKYFLSFGGLLILAIFSGMAQFFKKTWKFRPEYVFIIGITTFPMVENLIMLQHASWFSFDRLKVSVPLLLLSFTFIASIKDNRRFLFVTLCSTFIIATNIAIFRMDRPIYDRWGSVTEANSRIVDKLKAHPSFNCALFGSTAVVRGYLNLLLGHDIYEWQQEKDIDQRAKASHACASVIIKQESVFTDLPRITSIIIRNMSAGKSEELFLPASE